MSDVEQPTEPVNSVVVVNKLAQSLTFTVMEGGVPKDITLAGHRTSDPVAESAVTSYTRGLADAGHVKIRRVA